MPQAKRRCPDPKCDELVPCPIHKPASSQRPKTADRGYGSEHQSERERWWPLVAKGNVACRRGDDCKHHPDTLIHRGQKWDLGHPDEECPLPTAPEHRGCNRSAPGRIRGRRTRTT